MFVSREGGGIDGEIRSIVQTYTGPVPRFSKSPIPEATLGPSSRVQQKGEQVDRPSEATSSQAPQGPAAVPADSFIPTSNAQQLHTPQILGGVATSPSNLGQGLDPGLITVSNDTNGVGGGDLVLQQPSNPANTSAVEDPFGINAFGTGLTPGEFDDFLNFDLSTFDCSSFDFPNVDLTKDIPLDLGVGPQADPGTALFGQQGATQQPYGGSNANHGLAGSEAQLGHAGASVSKQTDIGDNTSLTSGLGLGQNTLGHSSGQAPNASDLSDFLADIPVQSIEQQQQATPAAQPIQADAGVWDNASSADNMPDHQLPAGHAGGQQPARQTAPLHPHPPPNPAAHNCYPPGCTASSAVLQDAHGVWYYDPHDSCHIALGHRHDMDGGVHFSGDMSLTQTFLAMQQKEAIGFLLGLATAHTILQCNGGGSINSSQSQLAQQEGLLLQQAADIAQGSIPLEMQERGVRVTVPRPEMIRQLCEINRVLPEGNFFEPFTNRVVQYDLPYGFAFRDGKQGNAAAATTTTATTTTATATTGNPSNQGVGTSGGPA